MNTQTLNKGVHIKDNKVRQNIYNSVPILDCTVAFPRCQIEFLRKKQLPETAMRS